jgi:hypothetical protein
MLGYALRAARYDTGSVVATKASGVRLARGFLLCDANQPATAPGREARRKKMKMNFIIMAAQYT